MKRLLLSLFILSFSSAMYAQQEFSVFTASGRGVSTTFVTDYQAIGINPANLGFKRTYDTKHVTFGLMEIGLSAYSEALTKANFKKSIGFNSPEFTYQQKIEAASNFANKALSINADINLFGISYQNDKLGGLAFGIRDCFRYYSKFNSQASDILFRGYGSAYFDQLYGQGGSQVSNTPDNYELYKDSLDYGKATNPLNMSKIFNGSKIQMQYYREYSLSYGKEFEVNDNISIGGGIGVKYLQGFAVIDANSDGSSLSARTAYSPSFNLDFGAVKNSNPSADSTSRTFPPKSAGKGFGTDFGLNVVIRENLKIGLAVTNIGSITYESNVYQVQDTFLVKIENGGANNYNVTSQFETFTKGDGFFKWAGNQKIKIKLPTMIRFGASLKLGEKGEVGFDVIIPATKTPGTFQSVLTAIGGDFKPVRWLRLSAGVSRGGNYSSRVTIPLGLALIVGENGTWELGVASRDAVTYFRNSGPALSMALGFLRFRI
jgi:hypothetical protein